MTLFDLIEYYQLFKMVKRIPLIKNLIFSCKHFAIEEIDAISIREILILMEMYQGDQVFKSFIGFKLKEKILKNKSLSVSELMSSISMCLDLEGLRVEII